MDELILSKEPDVAFNSRAKDCNEPMPELTSSREMSQVRILVSKDKSDVEQKDSEL